MRVDFNGSEYTLIDSLGRPCGWTRNKDTADKVAEAVKPYSLWTELPHKVRMSLVMAGFHAPN